MYMNKIVVIIASTVAALGFHTAAVADAALAGSNGCTACHQVDKKTIGPAYGQVAACYATTDAKKLAAAKVALAFGARSPCLHIHR
jgi:cytochrome c